MEDNLNTFALNKELNHLYDELQDFLENDFEFLHEAGLLDEDGDFDVTDNDWLNDVFAYYERNKPHDSPSNNDLESLIDLKNGLGDEVWDDNTELIHEDNARDVGEEFVINSVVIDIDTMNYIRPHIDFEAIGEEVLTDYASVEFRGETYYYQQR